MKGTTTICTTITHQVHQSHSLEDFRYQSGLKKGARIMNKPYWIRMEDGWIFDFIRQDTDVELLKHNIECGVVYIQDRIVEKT